MDQQPSGGHQRRRQEIDDQIRPFLRAIRFIFSLFADSIDDSVAIIAPRSPGGVAIAAVVVVVVHVGIIVGVAGLVAVPITVTFAIVIVANAAVLMHFAELIRAAEADHAEAAGAGASNFQFR
ncbi:hypothetical protein DFJ73DRAFT_894213 [Zopfochytrium polystomum]|nr:hypothetical protein DFJ73DRAFT_894213 [Zopfochytrium polystomum]